MTVKLESASLAVRDPAASARFYGEILGLETREEADGVRLILGPGQSLRLIRCMAEPGEPLLRTGVGVYPKGFHHVCLAVEEIEALRDRVCACGWPLERDVLRGTDGNLQFWVRDPDGYPVELMQMSDESLQRTSKGGERP